LRRKPRYALQLSEQDDGTRPMTEKSVEDTLPEDELLPDLETEVSEEQRILDAMEKLIAENAELKDRSLRLAAEMENLRMRTARDVRDAKAYSVSGFARDVLGVADNLRRALDALTPESRDGHDKALTNLIEGVELTERSLIAGLERHGVRKLEPKGQKFDPNFHQAMFEVPNPDVPNNTVVEVVQAGYQIGDRVLRPAMVGVAKGGPKLADVKPQTPAADDEA
jgi:molecular chaperone GrpE